MHKQAIHQATNPVLVPGCFHPAVLAGAGNVREPQSVLKQALLRVHGRRAPCGPRSR
jgi:hypothetical protein